MFCDHIWVNRCNCTIAINRALLVSVIYPAKPVRQYNYVGNDYVCFRKDV